MPWTHLQYRLSMYPISFHTYAEEFMCVSHLDIAGFPHHCTATLSMCTITIVIVTLVSLLLFSHVLRPLLVPAFSSPPSSSQAGVGVGIGPWPSPRVPWPLPLSEVLLKEAGLPLLHSRKPMYMSFLCLFLLKVCCILAVPSYQMLINKILNEG